MNSPNVTLGRPAEAEIHEIARADFTVSDEPWEFSRRRRTEIDAVFDEMKAKNPALWNGRVLLFRDCVFPGAALTGQAFETDYASFCAWHAWQRPDAGITNVFAAAAVEGSDGGFLLGRMGPHTANAGHIYFPCGTPDPEDVSGAVVDLEQSARRELLEETGLNAANFDMRPGWTAVSIGPFLALFKRMRASRPIEDVAAQAISFLDWQNQPELSEIVVVRTIEDISPQMPPFVTAFLRHALSSRLSA